MIDIDINHIQQVFSQIKHELPENLSFELEGQNSKRNTENEDDQTSSKSKPDHDELKLYNLYDLRKISLNTNPPPSNIKPSFSTEEIRLLISKLAKRNPSAVDINSNGIFVITFEKDLSEFLLFFFSILMIIIQTELKYK